MTNRKKEDIKRLTPTWTDHKLAVIKI